MIFVPMDSGDRWLTTADVIWKDRKGVLSEDFVYLERIYPRLKDLFVDMLRVKEDVDPECYARRWLKLQGESDRESRDIENILSAIYSELRPICLTNKEIRPKWWREFVDSAKVWTQEKRFENPSLVYVPDDGELRKIFQGNGVSFAWRPEKDSFSDWAALYRALDLPYLSEAVSLTLGENVSCKLHNRPAFLTKSAKILTAAWIREERPGIYKLLLTNKALDSFLNTKEAGADSLKIVYHLKEREIEASCDSFWDKAGELLLVTESHSSRTKNTVARMLAKALMPNRAYKDLADWIELVLGEEDWRWRIQQKNWRVPTELRNWMDGLKQQESSEPAEPEINNSTPSLGNEREDTSSKGSVVDSDEGAIQTPVQRPMPHAKQEDIEPKKGKDKRKVPVSPEEEDSSTPAARGFDFRSHLENAFNRPGATKVRDEREPNHQSVHNPERRREKEAEGHIKRITTEPDPVERRRKTERTILEGPDEQVRQSLGEWYSGKCQICGDTFPGRDGRPFFIANYIVPRKHARQVDTYANALCLCAEHFAEWQHGAVEGHDIIDQINSLKLPSEGGHDNLQLRVKLCGEECAIHFNEKHLLALQELLGVLP